MAGLVSAETPSVRNGWSIFLKKMLPKSLFPRAILILLIPLVMVQLITSYVFFDRHWDSVTKSLARTVAGDAAVASELVFQGHPFAWSWIHTHLNLKGRFVANGQISASDKHVQNGWIDDYLGKALQQNLPYPHALIANDDVILIKVQLPTGLLDLEIPRKQLSSKTTLIFIMWTLGSTVVFFLIAVLFMRNQVRPVARLALAAESFGKGQIIEGFKPGGAYEVRKAGIAFSLMQERISRYLKERTDMLTAISHDLRTPLTRMKLQLEMSGQGTAEIRALKQDIQDMEKMVEGYLAFARGEQGERVSDIDLSILLEEIILQFERHGMTIERTIEPGVFVTVRRNALKRCFSNLIENSTLYARRSWVSLHRYDKTVEIVFEDDGLGIPPEKYEDVFKPFYRLESSRNPDTGGIGLGLTIARDTIFAHGGNMVLDSSHYGGLKIVISLPL